MAAVVTTTNQTLNQTISDIIMRIYSSDAIRSAVFYNDELLGVFPVRPNPGDTMYRQKFETAGNASARRKPAELAAPPAAGNTTKIPIELAYETFDARVEFSRELIAALNNNAARLYNVIEDEMQSAQKALRQAINTEALGAARGGIQNAVAAAGTYMGQARAGQPLWRSLVTPVGGALTSLALGNHYENAIDKVAGQGQDISVILSAVAQIRNYNDLTAGVTGGPTRMLVQTDRAPRVDIGTQFANTAYQDIPWRRVDGLINTSIFFLDLSPWALREHFPPEVVQQGQRAADTDMYLNASYALTCDDAYHQSVMTTVNV